MENFTDSVENHNPTLDLGDLIEHIKTIWTSHLLWIVLQKPVKLKYFLCIRHKSWTKYDELDLKVVNPLTFIFYFEDRDELELVLKKSSMEVW